LFRNPKFCLSGRNPSTPHKTRRNSVTGKSGRIKYRNFFACREKITVRIPICSNGI
jgi:hypothetical protein